MEFIYSKEMVEELIGPYQPYVTRGRPYPAPLILWQIEKKSKKLEGCKEYPPGPGDLGAANGGIERIVGSRANRLKLIASLFPWRYDGKNPDEVTTSILNNDEKWSLVEWVGAHKDENAIGAKWFGHPALEEEIRSIGKFLDLEFFGDKIEGQTVLSLREEAMIRHGVGKYLMVCGCPNDDYNDIGRPTCAEHGHEGKLPGEYTHKQIYDQSTQSSKWQKIEPGET